MDRFPTAYALGKYVSPSELLGSNQRAVTIATATPPSDAALGLPPAGSAPAERLMSLDALRGFDMFWIVGAGPLVAALRRLDANPLTELLGTQLTHVDWEGFRFYDLIFPLFVFLIGVSIVFSLDRMLQRDGMARTVTRIVRRTALLFVLGVFYHGGLMERWPEVQLSGVLHRLAWCYGATALLYVALPRRALYGVCAALLVGYFLAMAIVPFPGVRVDKDSLTVAPEGYRTTTADGTPIEDPLGRFAHAEKVRGVYEPGYNLSNYIDFRYLPGKKNFVHWSAEGILSTLPAIASCLLGVFAGWCVTSQRTPGRKTLLLIVAGVLCLGGGMAWEPWFPIIKKLWTSSFVLITAGCSYLLLAAFYWIIDVRQWRRWCLPLVWIGANPLTIYLAARLISFRDIAERLAGGDVRALLDEQAAGLGTLFMALVQLALVFLLAWFLYRRKIFLRL